LTALDFPLTTIYYDKRLNDFGKRVRKKYVKTTIIVDDKSQIIVTYSVGEDPRFKGVQEDVRKHGQ